MSHYIFSCVYELKEYDISTALLPVFDFEDMVMDIKAADVPEIAPEPRSPRCQDVNKPRLAPVIEKNVSKT